MLQIAHHPSYNHPLPKGHRFPMEKYDLLPEQLLYEGTCDWSNFFKPTLPNVSDLLAVHDSLYYQQLTTLNLERQAARKIGFPLSMKLIQRELLISQGTIQAALHALEYGIAMNIAGGTHHAFSNRGEGFCMLNDQAIAARYLTRNNKANRILIIDLDVHQGNGTAAIFRDDPSVFTFSMHGGKNYPFRKEQSDLDIPLPDGTNDKTYLDILSVQLPQLLDLVQPDFIFYQCGVDILFSDKLGRMNVSIPGCKERDRLVLSSCHRNQIPVMCSMGGGYSEDIKIIIEAHANTYRLAQELFF